MPKPVGELLEGFTRYTFTTSANDPLPDDGKLYLSEVFRSTAETYSFEDKAYIENWLSRNGIPYSELKAEKMNLEDAFIGLTG